MTLIVQQPRLAAATDGMVRSDALTLANSCQRE
jgi:hypothetical protein